MITILAMKLPYVSHAEDSMSSLTASEPRIRVINLPEIDDPPPINLPVYAEQQLNAFKIAKELGLAVELRLDYVSGRGDIVPAEEIARAIGWLMDKAHTGREKVEEMADAAKKAVVDGGSSYVAMTRFIGDMIGG